MSIQGLSSKFKAFLGREDVLLALLVVAVSLTSFALGRASTTQKQTVFEANPTEEVASVRKATESGQEPGVAIPGSVPTERGYVASKNGTKYHLPWCPGASQIKEENKLWFATKEEAEKAGYSPAANCKF